MGPLFRLLTTAFYLILTMKRLFLILVATLSCLTNGWAAGVNFKDFPLTNNVKSTDLLLIDSALGGTNYVTRTATKATTIGATLSSLSTNTTTGTGPIVLLSAVPAASGANMTNTGPSAVGMVPVATDTTGTQWRPTNAISVATLTLNGTDLATQLTNKVAKAGDTMSGPLSFSGTTQPGLQLNRLTTTQRDALTGSNTNAGSTVWNTTQTRMNVHNGTAWTDGFVRLAGDTMTGALLGAVGTEALPSFSFAGYTGSGFSMPYADQLFISTGGTGRAKVTSSGVVLNSAVALIWLDGSLLGNADLLLKRDAAGTLAQRNGVNPQQVSIYDTYTDAANFRNGTIGWVKNANALTICTTNAGTAVGTGGSIILAPLGVTAVTITTNATTTVTGVLETTLQMKAGSYSTHYANHTAIDTGLALGSDGTVTWGSSSAAGGYSSKDCYLYRDAPGIVSMRSGTATTAYGTMRMAGLQGGAIKVLTSTTAADFLYVSVPNTNGIGGHVVYTVFATDGTDVQEIAGDVKFAAVAKATAVTATLADVQGPAALTGGSTLTAVIASNTTTNNVFALTCTATTSLSTTNLVIRWRLETPGTYSVTAL